MSLLKSKSLNKSGNFFNSTSRSKSGTLKSEISSVLDNTSLENVEIEFIKNLQQQVYFLELECNYLRQQLNLNGLHSSLKYDKKSQELKNEMLNIHLEKTNLEKSLREENEQKENAYQMLDFTEKSFSNERELLRKEIALLKKQKLELEENVLNRSVDLTRVKENLEKHHLNTRELNEQLTKLDNQLDNQRKDNVDLRAELNDSRTQLIARDNLIKDLQKQLADPQRKLNVNELKSSLSNVSFRLSQTSEALTKESLTSKQLQDEMTHLKNEIDFYKAKMNELNKENSRLSSNLEATLRQNESDLLLAKKNAEISKGNFSQIQTELEHEKSLHNAAKTQIEQFKLQEKLEIKNQNALKKRVKDLEDSLMKNLTEHEKAVQELHEKIRVKNRQLEDEKNVLSKECASLIATNKLLESEINELSDKLDKYDISHKVNLESTKVKTQKLKSELDEHSLKLINEQNSNKNLQMKVDNLVRQEKIHTDLITSLKFKINELETQLNEGVVNESGLSAELNVANERIKILEDEKRKLKNEVDLLNLKLKEIDRLKQLEYLVNSQKWGELGQLAESMKDLSRTMATSTVASTNRISFDRNFS